MSTISRISSYLQEQHVLRRIAKSAVVTAIALLILSQIVVRFFIWPQIPKHKDFFEKKLSSALHVNAEIGKIQTGWKHFRPSFEINDIKFHPQTTNGIAQPGNLLDIPSVSGIIGWDSLYSGLPRFYVFMTRDVTIQVFRSAEGAWEIAGIPIVSSGKDPQLLLWALRENQLQASNITLQIFDEYEKTTNTQFHIQNFELANNWLNHEINFLADLNKSIGNFQLHGKFQHRIASERTNWLNWQGHFDWSAEGMNISNLIHLTSLPARGSSGDFRIDGKLNLLHGGIVEGSTLFDAEKINIFWEKTKNSLQLENIHAEINQSSDKEYQIISIPYFYWQFLNDKTHQVNNLNDLTLRFIPPKANKSLQDASLSAPKLSLTQASRLGLSLPLPNKWFKTLQELQPSGEVQNIEASLVKKKPVFQALNLAPVTTTHFRITGELSEVGWNESSSGIPGVQGLNGPFATTESEGSFDLSKSSLKIQASHYISASHFEIAEPRGQLLWRKLPEFWEINGHQLKLQNKDIHLAGELKYLIPTTSKSEDLDLSLKIVNTGAKELVKYLPLAISDSVIGYLKGAIQGGTIDDAAIEIHGDPEHIPYSTKYPGKFSVHAKFNDVAYVPLPLKDKKNGEWPAITDATVLLKIQNEDLKLKIPSAKYQQVNAKDFLVQMNLSANTKLAVEGSTSGPLNDYVKYISATPLGYKFRQELRHVALTGDADLHLKLEEAFKEKNSLKLFADLSLGGNQIQYEKYNYGQIGKGKIQVDEKGLLSADINGNFLGGPVKILNSTNNYNVIEISGRADTMKLMDFLPEDLSVSPKILRAKIHGPVSYQGSLERKELANNLNLNLDLKQTAIEFPEPAVKNSGVAMNGFIKASQPFDKSLETTWQVRLGNLLQAQGTSKNGAIQKQGIAIGNITPMIPVEGNHIALDLDTLDVDGWLKILNPTPTSSTAPLQAISIETKPTTVVGKIHNMRLLKRSFNDLTFDAKQRDGTIQGHVTSPQVNGSIVWKSPTPELPDGEVFAKLSKLHIPNSNDPSPSLPSSKEVIETSHSKIPQLDVFIGDLSVGQRSLGELQLVAKTKPTKLQIEKLLLKNRYAKLTGTGAWNFPTGTSLGETELNLDFNSENIGDFLTALGTKENIMAGGEGGIKGNLNWQGSPYAFNLQSLSGALDLSIKDGKILQVDPGAAKLLGILSLQSLFKFATFNIKGSLGEVVSPGTPFDRITGSGVLRRGNVRINEFEMMSTLAQVNMRGVIGLTKETQDLRATITPRINLASASLAAFYFINPIVGLSALVGQYLLTSGVNKALQSDYLIQGSWQKPEVIPLDQQGQPIDPEVLSTIRRKKLLEEQVKEPAKPRVPKIDPSLPVNQ